MNDGATPDPPTDLDRLFGNDPERIGLLVSEALADRSTELALPSELARRGLTTEHALSIITPYLRAAGRDLGDPGFLAHMDPPTPWITWIVSLLGASSNQNLLHPDTAPAARDIESTVVEWLAPIFGMGGGHLVPGSTVANLTALWAARDITGADTVVSSTNGHLSIGKAAAILGLRHLAIEPGSGRQRHGSPPGPTGAAMTAADLASAADAGRHGAGFDLRSTIVVPTAGTTGVGAIDQLDLDELPAAPAWIHVDSAWAGPLRFSRRHRHRLAAIERADSMSLSAHKWLYQPKESAVVMFNDVATANRAITTGGAYLRVPNIGILGSHGTAAAPLAATLLALGLDGVERLVDHGMSLADQLVALVEAEPRLVLFGPNESGVVAWRHRHHDSSAIQAELSDAFVSTVDIAGTTWLRSVAANPMADPDRVVGAVLTAGERLDAGG
ncbi:MAG: pyridoxal phosphate-dependent decarboxylase family protein [Acidimicrobiales bacterium]